MAKRQYHRKVYKKSRAKKFLRLILKLLGALFLLLALGFLSIFIYYTRDFPRPEKFTTRMLSQSTKIYDRSGKILLYNIYGEQKRTVVPLSVIPKHLQQAVIAAEDANFYHHFGIDPKSILRAFWADLESGHLTQGGSTISQQLIRSSFLNPEKTVGRKLREIILALELERRYSKNQILEFYLNQVPFGSNTYGVAAASQTFFNKPVQEIDLAESATLASLIRAPSYLSPYGAHKNQLVARKNYILDCMAEQHYISSQQAQKAKKEKLKFAKKITRFPAPHFVMYVKKELEVKYGEQFLKTKGLRVYTSLDWQLQQAAEEIVKQGVENNKKFNASNAALVAIDPRTGEILAMVGSKDYFNIKEQGNVNVAIRPRQPGSAFKPFVYATAFEKGASDKNIVIDKKTNFGIWGGKEYIPRNYDGKFRGPVTLREALAQSLNVPSVKVLVNIAGIQDSIKTAKSLGITTLNKKLSFYGPALVLGGGEVKLLDIVSAYGVFATEGLKVPPVSILRIEDANGNIIEQNKKTPRRVLSAQIARIINDILSDNEARAPMFGLNSFLYFKAYQVAAKTGTTQKFCDAWTIGYTPSIAVGVWVGNNDNSPMLKKPGVALSGPIWHNFMARVLPMYPKQSFKKPDPILLLEKFNEATSTEK